MRVFSRCFEISNYLKCIIVSAGNRYPCSNKKIHDFGNLRSFASHTNTWQMPVGCLLRDWHLQNAEKKKPSCSDADFGFGCEAYNCSIDDCTFILRPTHALHGILKCCMYIDQYKQLQTSCFETFYRQQNNGQWYRGNNPRALFTTPPLYMIEKANKSCSRHRNSKTNKILFFKKKKWASCWWKSVWLA